MRQAAYLPANIPYPPTIRKVNPADTPILVLGLTSDTLPLTTVDAYAENILVPKISQISGVGQVGIGGQQKPAIRVQVDPQALANRGISLEDVRNVLGQANVDQPKGTLNSPRQTFTSTPMISCSSRTPIKPDHRLPQWRAGAHQRHRPCDRGAGERLIGRLVQQAARHHPGGSARAGRQRDRDSRPHQGVIAAAAGVDAARDQSECHFRSHPDHPRVGQRRPVHAGADRGAGRDGDLHFSA